MEWMVLLHDELFLGRQGRVVNAAAGGLLFVLMAVTGLVLWWQGRTRWWEGLMIRPGSGRSFLWQLHSVLGFWSLLLILVWGVTSLYFAFPAPFEFIIDTMDDDLNDFERPEGWLLGLLKLHFGRFGGLAVRWSWVVLGLLPAVLFFTGFILWWRRVIKRRPRGPVTRA